MTDSLSRRVVVTGMGVISPIGSTKEEVWSHLASGTSGIGPLKCIPSGILPTNVGGEADHFTGHINEFGPLEKDRKRAVRKNLKLMCREIQMGVASALLAMDDGALPPGSFDPNRTGAVFGTDYMMTIPQEFHDGVVPCMDQTGKFDFLKWADEGMTQIDPLWILKYLPNMPASHVAIFNQLYGPNNSITIREASSNLAFGESYCTIQRESAEAILAGGAGTRLHPVRTIHLAMQEELAHGDGPPETQSRPFDLNRTGQVVGEGAATLIFEELETAQKRDAVIMAEVIGFGNSAVISHNMVGDVRKAVKNSIDQALRTSGLTPDQIGHVNAHGLGTRAMDIAEAQGIRDAFGDVDVPVVVPKSYFGNLGAGSGAVELLASIMALNKGHLFRTLNYDTPDPECPLNIVTTDDATTGDTALSISVTPQGQAGTILVKRYDG